MKMNKKALLNYLLASAEWIDLVADKDEEYREQQVNKFMEAIDQAHEIIQKLKASEIKK